MENPLLSCRKLDVVEIYQVYISLLKMSSHIYCIVFFCVNIVRQFACDEQPFQWTQLVETSIFYSKCTANKQIQNVLADRNVVILLLYFVYTAKHNIDKKRLHCFSRNVFSIRFLYLYILHDPADCECSNFMIRNYWHSCTKSSRSGT